ncbi:MAG: alpha/beta hydrolase [Treponema sp.]|jgi:fermentation-respiration switch protein FrsA (DUF1100 family)|nr:alpha/beta hydrolase [Treponema sp.]
MALVIVLPCLVLVLLAGIVIFALPRYFYRFTVGRKAPGPGEPGWLDTQAVEDLWIESRDGLKLHAYYVDYVEAPNAPGAPEAPDASGARGLAILVHGYSGDARQLAYLARVFHDTFGMSVLLPDARGHGQSQGHYIGFGWHERLDILDWMDKVRGRTRGAAIVLFGISMGASTVLMASGEAVPPGLRLIIADCGYTSVAEELAWQMKRRYRFFCAPLLRAVSRLTLRRAGYSFEEASALEQVKKSHVPTLFIHGEADTFVPFEMCARLYEACAAEKELYTVPGAEHGAAYNTDADNYERRLALFLEKYLGRLPNA